MTETVKVHGREVTLDDLNPEDGFATDVVILVRVVRVLDPTTSEDSLHISSTSDTTGIVQEGMLSVARQSVSKSWEHNDGD